MKKVFAFLLLIPALASAEVRPLPLGSAANTSFADERAEDREGGWIDAGQNDLRVMTPGDLMAGGVPFAVTAGDKTCIVLGGPSRAYLPKSATLDVAGAKGKGLYLLHAVAFPPKPDEVAGLLTVEYADSKTKPSEFRVRFGRDVADWQKPTGYPNAARAWTAYSGNTQVSLFASRFTLREEAVKRIRFEAV
ncbi:MAG: hypothetical protein FWG50_04330, partial [Kiritimatiellaeota bacterium]|nr:hypothetical protein [Kiritimatiellota bacterium]